MGMERWANQGLTFHWQVEWGWIKGQAGSQWVLGQGTTCTTASAPSLQLLACRETSRTLRVHLTISEQMFLELFQNELPPKFLQYVAFLGSPEAPPLGKTSSPRFLSTDLLGLQDRKS